ncbi:AEC family transporter [Nesterenkonia massiliensis]|uniref:AEC family transporter n=1 Tax=Nesterenkonia massiliensis TaxID=1232429 RepID=UPI00040B9820|nr:AEC family transporter [Nesterenkonia massiliensis]
MDGVLLGFSIVAVLVGVGVLTAAVAPEASITMQKGVTPLVYYITNPCLMVTLVAETDVRSVAGVYAPLALGIALIAGGAFVVFALLARRSAADTAVGAMSSSYVNAGNIGVPVALYIVGSTGPVVAVLLAQLLVLAPAYLTVFGLIAGRSSVSAGRGVAMRTIVSSVLNPTTLGVLVGALLSLFLWRPPEPLWEPLRMLGEASIPLLLLIYGMALWKERPFTVRERLPDSLVALACKGAVMPLAAWVLGGPVLGLEGADLLGVVAMAALPTAQNVYLFGLQHGMPATVTKDVIFGSSFLALPVTLLAAWLIAV